MSNAVLNSTVQCGCGTSEDVFALDIIQRLITACGVIGDVQTVAYDPIGSYPTKNGVVRVGQRPTVTRQALDLSRSPLSCPKKIRLVIPAFFVPAQQLI